MKTTTHSPSLVAAMQAASDLATELDRIALAARLNFEQTADAGADHTFAVAALTSADTALALASDEASSKKLEQKAKAAAARVDELRPVLERRERVGKALAAQRSKTIADLEASCAQLEAEVNLFGNALRADLGEAMRMALGPFVEVLKTAHAIDAATGRGWFAGLAEVSIPTPARWDRHIVRGDRYFEADESLVLLRDDARQDEPAIVAARGPVDVLRRIKAAAARAKSGAPRQPTPEGLAQAAAEAEADRLHAAAQLEARSRPASAKGWTLPGPGFDSIGASSIRPSARD